MTNISIEKRRESNIEALRAILALMVIVLHFNNANMPGGGGAFALVSPASIRGALAQFTESLFCCAVNTFILISGYFCGKKKEIYLDHVISLFKKVIFYNLLFYIIAICLKLEPFYLKTAITRIIPTNYFVLLYSVIYLFIPFINYVINGLSDRKLDLLMLLLLLAFTVEPTLVDILQDIAKVQIVGVNTVAMEGDFAGYTITNFFLMYFLGAYLRKRNVLDGIKTSFWVLIYFITALMIFSLSHFVTVMFYYSNVLVIIESVALFKVFQTIRIPQSGIVNTIGGAAFDIFLIHTNPLFLVYFWGQFKIAENYAELPGGMVILFSALAVISMYLLCFIIALIYKKVFKKAIDRFGKARNLVIRVQD